MTPSPFQGSDYTGCSYGAVGIGLPEAVFPQVSSNPLPPLATKQSRAGLHTCVLTCGWLLSISMGGCHCGCSLVDLWFMMVILVHDDCS